MANEKNAPAAAKTPKNVIKAPVPFFRFDEPSITGVLMKPIAVGSDEDYGKRTHVELDVGQFDIPKKYAASWSVVPVGSKVTVTKEGHGRDTTYTIGWD